MGKKDWKTWCSYILIFLKAGTPATYVYPSPTALLFHRSCSALLHTTAGNISALLLIHSSIHASSLCLNIPIILDYCNSRGPPCPNPADTLSTRIGVVLCSTWLHAYLKGISVFGAVDSLVDAPVYLWVIREQFGKRTRLYMYLVPTIFSVLCTVTLCC